MQNSPIKTSSSIIIAAVSAIIFGLVGIVAIIGQIRAVNSTNSEPAVRGEESVIKSNITPFILEKLAAAQKAKQAKLCANCGVVDSIIENEVKEDSGGVELVAGHKIEKNANKTVTHQVKVRMDNGTYRIVSQQDQPVFHVGEKVKIVNGVVVQLEKATMTDKNAMFALMLIALTSRLF